MGEATCSAFNLFLPLSEQRSLIAVRDKLHHDTKKFLNKTKLDNIFTYLLLVLEGYRDGYLIDGWSATSNCVLCLLRSLNDSLALVNMTVQIYLVAIELGPNLDDFLIIRSDRLQEKIAGLSAVKWMNAPLVIDVNGSIPALCGEDEILYIQLSLQETFRNMWQSKADSFSVIASDKCSMTVGFPFIAGWLLGYPCVYRSTYTSIHEKADGPPPLGNALSMVHLRQFRLFANINQLPDATLHKKKAHIDESSRKYERGCGNKVNSIDLFEFTVPVDLINESLPQFFALNAWLESKMIVLKEYNNSLLSKDSIFRLVDFCDIVTEDMTLPSLVL